MARLDFEASFRPVPVLGVPAARHHEGDERNCQQDEDGLDSVADHRGTSPSSVGEGSSASVADLCTIDRLRRALPRRS